MAVISKSDAVKAVKQNIRKNAQPAKVNNPKGRGAEKLKLDMGFSEAVNLALNTKIKEK